MKDAKHVSQDRSKGPRPQVTNRPFSVSEPLADANVEGWFLETKTSDARGLSRIKIERLPFRIGRGRSLDLTLASRAVSSEHAEIYVAGKQRELRVRDLGSTNGTFVNDRRVEDAVLAEGDVLHVADSEFRIKREQHAPGSMRAGEGADTVPFESGNQLPHGFVRGAEKLLDFMRGEAFAPVFQPIVRLPDGGVVAYEALTRGRHPDLPENPNELFAIAAELKLEPELSRAFRRKALQGFARRRSGDWILFLNSHPEERLTDLIRSASDLRRLAPGDMLVLEIHEKALADPEAIRSLQTRLAEHRIGIAFDDFGVGQSRLVELAEAPPDYLKFDISFISKIDSAPAAKRNLLGSLVAAARDLGVRTIAEGVETAAEAEACTAIGFTHAQGYFFGRPVQPSQL
jgi:EAL domain-containing protein (putative c-di-GMP-specific phosphodiesterase class I)